MKPGEISRVSTPALKNIRKELRTAIKVITKIERKEIAFEKKKEQWIAALPIEKKEAVELESRAGISQTIDAVNKVTFEMKKEVKEIVAVLRQRGIKV